MQTQKMHKLIFIVLATVVSFSHGQKILPLADLEGLRFEKIGELKLILKYKTLSFHINIATVESMISNAAENLDMIEGIYRNDSKRILEVEKLKTNLELRNLELQDALHGLIQTAPNSRRTRRGINIFDSLSAEDGRRIQKDLNNFKDTINNIIDVHNGLKYYLKEATEQLNGTIEEMGRRAALSNAILLNDEVERKVNAIIKTMTKERLNGDIITISEFQDCMQNLTKNLSHGEELPYHKIAEYYYNLRVTHIIDNNLIKLEMDVPIIEQSSRQLYKILEIPARNQDKLILIDAQWKYVAINSNESTVMMSLDSCYKSKNSMFYCETQSPLKSIDSHDCVTNALVKRKIDIKLCETTVVKSSNLTFIRLNDGQYFYFTPSNETLNITCRADTNFLQLHSQSIGILELEPGCKAVSKLYTLITTVKSQEEPYIKENILSVSFDIEEVKENIKSHNTPVLDKFYLDSLKALRDMNIPEVQKIQELNFVASFASSEIFMYLLLIVLIVYIVHLLYKTYMWFLNSCKCLKVQTSNDDGCKKIAYDV